MSGSADLILINANVITCDPAQPQAQAVAVRGDRIWRVGNNNIEVEELRGKSTQVIDCQGQTLIPGFNDAHCHFFSLVRKLFSLDLSPAAVSSIQDIQDIIRRKVRFLPEGTWISGTDYNDFYLKEKRHPTRQDLDKAAPNHPVIIHHRSLHAIVLNSLALKMVGINNETEEPPGSMIDRDLETGEPNGILYEMQEYLRPRIKSPISGAELDYGIMEANQKYLSLGITSIGEATVTNNLRQWETFSQLKSDEKVKSRIYMMPGMFSLKEFREAGLKTGSGDNNLKLGSLKIVLTEATGQLQPDQTELNETVLEATRNDFQVAIHAVETSTVKAAIQALELTNKKIPLHERRPRIEHCSECPPELVQRLKRLNAVIVSQPPFMYYHGERYLVQVPEETQKWLYPFRSWIENGLIVAGSSDSPIVPFSPLMGMYGAITRKAETGQVITPDETVTARQALEMYTTRAAYATFEENLKGSLAEGQLADMILLNGNPLNSPPEQLKEIQVTRTFIDGKVEWEA